MSGKVRVQRNRYGLAGQPWLVNCSLCAGDSSFLAGLFGEGVKGWAPTWQVAQDYAHRHAIEHEKTRCPTCLHIPAEPVPSEKVSH